METARVVPGTPAWRVKSLLWYLKRPRLYPQFVRNVRSRLLRRDLTPDTRREAEAWCEQRVVDLSEALARITGSSAAGSVRDEFGPVFARAERTAAECPVEMGGPANLDLLYRIAEHLQARSVIETGVAYGWSSLALLLSLAKRGGSLLISTDMPYTNRNNDRYVGCVVPDELRPHWQIIRRADRDGLPAALKKLPSLDMCHYDSDKSYAGRMWAYPRLFGALRPGGCFISDDVADNLAFRDFCRHVETEPVVLRGPMKYVGVLIKGS